MPVLRYRIEIDPTDVQTQVATAAQAVAGGLQQTFQAGQQGVAFAGQAINSVAQDLTTLYTGLPGGGAQRLAPPIASGATDVRQMGMFGLGLAAGGITPAPVNVFQGQFAREAQFELGTRARLAAMQVIGGGVGVGLNVAAIAALATGAGIPAALGLEVGAMGWNVLAGGAIEMAAGQERIGALLRNRGIRDRRAAELVSRQAITFGVETPGIDVPGALGIAQRGIQAGAINVRGDVNQLPQETRRFLQNVRDISRALRTTNEEATNVIAELRGLGITQREIRETAFAGARAGPMRARQIQMQGLQGARMAQQLGVPAAMGRRIGVEAAIRARPLARELPEALVGIVGGETGIAQIIQQAQFQFPTTPMGRAAILAMVDPETGQINPARLAQFQAGQLDVTTLAMQRAVTPQGQMLLQQLRIDPRRFAQQAGALMGPSIFNLAQQQAAITGLDPQQTAIRLAMNQFGMNAAQAQIFLAEARQRIDDPDLVARTNQQDALTGILEETRRRQTWWQRNIARPAARGITWAQETIAESTRTWGDIFTVLGETTIFGRDIEAEISDVRARRDITPEQRRTAIRRLREELREEEAITGATAAQRPPMMGDPFEVIFDPIMGIFREAGVRLRRRWGLPIGGEEEVAAAISPGDGEEVAAAISPGRIIKRIASPAEMREWQQEEFRGAVGEFLRRDPLVGPVGKKLKATEIPVTDITSTAAAIVQEGVQQLTRGLFERQGSGRREGEGEAPGRPHEGADVARGEVFESFIQKFDASITKGGTKDDLTLSLLKSLIDEYRAIKASGPQ